jgi:hypothetical protein|nr:hypothetical protein [Candidatus Krumholzibacteria bacterium]
MLKYFTLIAMSLLLLIGGCSGDNQAEQAEQAAGDVHAAAADSPVPMTIAEFNARGEEYEGKLVEVEGIVDHVCKHSGKRLFIRGDNPEDRVKIESGDVGTFDIALEGSKIKVLATGTVMKMDNAYLDNWAKEVGGDDPAAGCSEEQKEIAKGGGDQQEEHDSAMSQINALRAELAASGREYLAFCSLEARSFEEVK